jgi:hypothetical protein
MIASDAVRKAGFMGDGVTAVFPFTFKVFAAADLLVVQTNLTPIDTTQNLTSQYTVALNANQDSNPGGNVTMLTPPPAGYLLTIGSQMAQTQPMVLTNTGGFYPTVLNNMADWVTILIQQLSEKLGRSLTLPFSSSASTLLPAAVAGTLLGWNAGGNAIVNYPTGTSVATLPVVVNIAGLRAQGIPPADSICTVLGYVTPGDGGQGIFWWNPADTTADNGGTVFACTANGVAAGRFNKLF